MTERLAVALASNDLQLKEAACDLDKVIGSGWAAQHRRLGALAFWSKYCGDRERAIDLIDAMRKVSVQKARRMRRGESRQDLHRIADAVLVWWLFDKCPTCQGRGMMVLEQITTNLVCHECKGTGIKRSPSAHSVGLDWDEERFNRKFTDLQMVVEGALLDYLRSVGRHMRGRESQEESATNRAQFIADRGDRMAPEVD